MKAVEAVFFDMDGLMFDTEKIYFQSNVHVLNKMGVDFTKDDYGALVGASGQAFVDAMLPFVKDMDGFNHFINEADGFFMNTITNDPIPLKKGLLELLDYLKKLKVKMGVVSSSNRQVVSTLLSRAEVEDYFSFIVAADDVKNTKPDKEPYLQALELAGVDKTAAWVLEDSINGILSAKNAGIQAIMVPDMAEATEEAINYSELVVTSLLDVKDYFEELIE